VVVREIDGRGLKIEREKVSERRFGKDGGGGSVVRMNWLRN